MLNNLSESCFFFVKTLILCEPRTQRSEMSSAKKIKLEEKTTVSGFIQHVSPVKTSRTNNRYFNATLQIQRGTFSKVARFDPSKHSMLVEASNARTPLKLNDVQIVPSKFDSSKSEVLVNYKTEVEVCRELAFTYQRKEIDDTAGKNLNYSGNTEYSRVQQGNFILLQIKQFNIKYIFTPAKNHSCVKYNSFNKIIVIPI